MAQRIGRRALRSIGRTPYLCDRAAYDFPMSLLEREHATAELLAAVERLTVDGGRVVAVVGEAGIGKTSLLDAVARQVCDRVRVLWAGCEALFTPRPLGPLHDIAPE